MLPGGSSPILGQVYLLGVYSLLTRETLKLMGSSALSGLCYVLDESIQRGYRWPRDPSPWAREEASLPIPEALQRWAGNRGEAPTFGRIWSIELAEPYPHYRSSHECGCKVLKCNKSVVIRGRNNMGSLAVTDCSLVS
jgi:hypothetical protein